MIIANVNFSENWTFWRSKGRPASMGIIAILGTMAISPLFSPVAMIRFLLALICYVSVCAHLRVNGCGYLWLPLFFYCNVMKSCASRNSSCLRSASVDTLGSAKLMSPDVGVPFHIYLNRNHVYFSFSRYQIVLHPIKLSVWV